MHGVMMALPQAIIIPRQEPRPTVVVTGQPLSTREELELERLIALAPMYVAYQDSNEKFRLPIICNQVSEGCAGDAARYANLAMQHFTLARLSMRVTQTEPPEVFTN